MRRRLAAIVVALALAGLSQGCALSPWDPDTLPPIGNFETRITQGLGTTPEYSEGVEVEPGSTIQVRTSIADGTAVEFTVPAGPAPELEIGVNVEGEEETRETLAVSGADGEPITLSDPAGFDPGYLGVERHFSADGTRLRVIAPRLTGTPQGSVPFTFKLSVGP